MGAFLPNIHFARCLAFLSVVLSVNLSLVLASHGEIFLGMKNEERRQPGVQFTLSVPSLPSTDHQFSASISHDLDPDTSLPHSSSVKTADKTSLPLSGLAELATGDESAQAMLVMAYYPDWLGLKFPPSRIDFQRFDWIDFAFAVPDADFSLQWDDPGAPQLLEELVAAAHDAGAKVKLSIGGWTGSKHFSSAVASDSSRSTFVDNILETYNSFQLDGIDIDWEYPGKKGAGSHFNSKDSVNFLSFLRLLRTKLPPTAYISAAVETTTFAGNNGKPMLDLSDFAQVLDWVLIMNYDVWGSSRDPGPNAPLRDACNNSTQPDANAVSAYNAWTSAKFPANKLVLGLPSYGYISSSTVDHLRTRSTSTSNDGSSFVTAVSEDGGSDSQIQFRELIDQGILVRSMDSSDSGTNSSTPMFVGSGGFERLWDACSDTPYLRSTHSGQIITYDEPESLGIKAGFAKGVGMRGVNLFDVHGDTDQWDLMDVVRKSLT